VKAKEELMSPRSYNKTTAIPSYNLRAEVRGVEENHKATLNDDGSFTVVSETDPSQKYRVTFVAFVEDGMLWFKCTCPSGLHRFNHFVPCKHATRVARRLERSKVAHWKEGHWFLTEPPAYTGPDLFED
jgi:hypothetical protein